MSDLIKLNQTIQETTQQLPAEAVEAAHEFAQQAKSANTVRAYRAQVKIWVEWKSEREFNIGQGATEAELDEFAAALEEALPADPVHVATWLADRAKAGSSRATIRGALAAIKYAHKERSHDFDDRHNGLSKVVNGIMRAESTARNVKQAKPLKADMLRDILKANADTPHSCRDACVVAMLYSFGLRRSELVTLDYQTQGDGLGTLEIEGSIARVTLLRSKSDQEKAVAVEIERDASPRAFAAIEAWIRHGSIGPGTPLVRGIDPAGTISSRRLHDNRVAYAVKSAVERHYIAQGTEPSKARELAAGYSGHSGRVGLVVSAVEGGQSDTSIMSATRHKSPAMVALYGKQARDRMASPLRNKKVGV